MAENAVGRPCELTDEILEKTKAYLEGYESCGDVIPSIAGLSCELGKARSTIYQWKSDGASQEFTDMLDAILASQERKCLNKGLSGDFNSAITKLILCKHGYSDKPEVDEDNEPPPIAVHFHVKGSVKEIKTTNAKS